MDRVSKHRWQQEERLEWEKEGGGGKVGGMKHEEAGLRELDWQVKCKGGC